MEELLKEEVVLTLLKNKINSLIEQGEEVSIEFAGAVGVSYLIEYKIGEISSSRISSAHPSSRESFYLKVKEVDYRELYPENMLKEVFCFLNSKYNNMEEIRKRKEVIESIEYLKDKTDRIYNSSNISYSRQS